MSTPLTISAARQEIKSQACPVNCEQCLILVPQLNNIWSYLDFCPSEEKIQWNSKHIQAKSRCPGKPSSSSTYCLFMTHVNRAQFRRGSYGGILTCGFQCCQNISALLNLPKMFSWWKRSSQLTTAAHLVSLLFSQQHDHSAYQLPSSELVRPVS